MTKYTIVVARYDKEIDMVRMGQLEVEGETEELALGKAAELVGKTHKSPYNWRMYANVRLVEETKQIVCFQRDTTLCKERQ